MNEEIIIEDVPGKIKRWMKGKPFTAIILGIVFLAFLLLNSMLYTVDRNEQGVVTRLGAYDRMVGPGLQIKFPDPIERVYVINTLQVFEKEFGFRTREADVRSERQRRGFEKEAFMLTGDLGVARVEWVVQYRRSEPRNYVFNVQNEERLIRDASEEAVRRIVGDFVATDVITVARVEIARSAHRELQTIMDKYNSGIVIEDLLIQQTEPPEPVAPAFKEVDSARQDRERLRLEAEAVQEKVIPEARGEAERIVAEARGDAARFREVLQEYKQFPEVTRTRMFLEQMQEVMKRTDRIYIVDDEVKSILPHMDLENGRGPVNE
ncbi:MAG: FtsH protease activity modulator HflK [Elusimicrobiota bacterium]